MEKEQEVKAIEVVSGDGSNLEVSKVSEHIPSLKPKTKDNKKTIVIPTQKKDTSKE